MKLLVICFLVVLHHTVHYVDSSAIPPGDVKESTEKESKAIQGASLPEIAVKLSDTLPEASHHNSVLNKDAEEGSVELVDKPEAAWNSRQLIFNDHVNLKWVKWTGSLPAGAVSIRNNFLSRTDYICAESECSTGFYSPAQGSYCYYSYNGREFRTSSFSILVNEDNFELIQWLQGSYGSVPENPISRCSGAAIYVGKNNYGLGKVIPQQKALLIPYKGSEYSYDYYEVLSLYTSYHTQKISNLRYYTDEASFDEHSFQVLATAKVLNNVCQNVKKVATVSKTTTIEQNWYIDRPTKWDVATLLTTGIPTVTGTSVSFSPVETVEWSEAIARVRTTTHLRNVEVLVPPNHSCEVILRGREITSRVPFHATLSRHYHNNQERSTFIRGTFTNVQMEYVSAMVQECKRLPNSPPCRSA